MPSKAPRIEAALKESEPALLRDPHIREPLHHWLLAAHANDPETTEILHELKIPRPSARIDVAVINGKMCGFEIKSDVDSLVRLERQARAFSAIFDRVSVVVTERHLKAARRAIPAWWGIIVAKSKEPGVSFVSKRIARDNRNPDTAALLYMLTRKELLEVLDVFEMAKGRRNQPVQYLIDTILDSIAVDEIRARAKITFKKRSVSSHGLSSSSSSSSSSSP